MGTKIVMEADGYITASSDTNASLDVALTIYGDDLMAALTKITRGVIKPNENYDTHNINSTGVINWFSRSFCSYCWWCN